MTNRLAWSIGVVLAVAALAAHAGPERERIAAERNAATARFAEQERACSQRFVVTSCVDAARKEQRLTLDRLHRAELVLDESERREAAAKRRQALQEHAAAQSARASEPVAEARRTNTRVAPPPKPRAIEPAPQRPASAADERRAVEQRSEAGFAARTRAAQAHRETVERRNAQRAKEGKAAAPLPVPSSASAP